MQAVENMCFHKLSESLYVRLREMCNEHIRLSLQQVVQHVGTDVSCFLKHMNTCWEQHCQQMLLIRSIFLYLDRSYVLSQADPQIRSIFEMGLQQFRGHLQSLPQVRPLLLVITLVHQCCRRYGSWYLFRLLLGRAGTYPTPLRCPAVIVTGLYVWPAWCS